jgi:hypothetical protein
MADTHTQRSTANESDSALDPAERLVQHLLRNPSDLIDSCRLMRRFRASVQEFQRALQQLEQRQLSEENNPA